MAAVDSSTLRPPPLTQSDAATSLLSLGLTNGPAPILPVSHTTSTSSTDSAGSAPFQASPSTSLDNRSASLSASTVPAAKHHRRLGSTGKTRRRLSDAREASARPFPQHSLLSLASLSLSTSPGALSSKPIAPRPQSGPNSYIAPSDTCPPHVSLSSSTFESVLSTNLHGDPESVDKAISGGSTPIPIFASGKQKKRGVDYKCESCAKIYRHPNCLNKHRWEHTRQWREASKFVLSKHQQVQLLEAAAILSFMGTPSTSLPEDRSEWPSFLSGGSLPKVDSAHKSAFSAATTTTASHDHHENSARAVSSPSVASDGSPAPYSLRPHPVPLSTSVPARMSSTHGSHGPRMHDFTVSPSSSVGVLGSGSAAAAATTTKEQQQWRPGSGLVGVHHHGSTRNMSPLMHPSPQLVGSGFGGGGGAVYTDGAIHHHHHHHQPSSSHIPSSSIRSESSASAGSGSRSRSGSRSNSRSDGSEQLDPDVVDDDDDDDEDVDVVVMDADTAAEDDNNNNNELEKPLVSRDMMTTTTTTTTGTATRKGSSKVTYGADAAVSAPVPMHLHNHHHPRGHTAYNAAIGAYPYGSYGSYRQSGYGSYGSSDTATAGSLGSHTGFFSSYGNSQTNRNDDPGHVSSSGSIYGHHRRANNSLTTSRTRMHGFKSEEDDRDHDMGVTVKEEEAEAEDEDLERRWNGMEMEVDMDMD